MAELQSSEIPANKEIKGRIIYSGNLYHGSGEEKDWKDPRALQLHVPFNYCSPRPFGEQHHKRLSLAEGSQTLGYALYTTSDEQNAIDYARDRARAFHKKPHLYSLSVRNLPLFDVRTPDERHNGHVPLSIAQQWWEYVYEHEDEALNQYEVDSVNRMMAQEELNTYSNFMANFVDRLKAKKEDTTDDIKRNLRLSILPRNLTIHDMLMQIQGDRNWGVSGYAYAQLWSKFVIEKLNSNGVIAIESGDTRSKINFKPAATVALYQLDNSFVSNQTSTPLSN